MPLLITASHTMTEGTASPIRSQRLPAPHLSHASCQVQRGLPSDAHDLTRDVCRSVTTRSREADAHPAGRVPPRRWPPSRWSSMAHPLAPCDCPLAPHNMGRLGARPGRASGSTAWRARTGGPPAWAPVAQGVPPVGHPRGGPRRAPLDLRPTVRHGATIFEGGQTSEALEPLAVTGTTPGSGRRPRPGLSSSPATPSCRNRCTHL